MAEALNKILPRRKDPKREAMQFLRVLGVEYNDLITGDHAADLLVKALHTFTDYQRHMDMLCIWEDSLRLQIATATTPWVMQQLGVWGVQSAKYSREDIERMVGRGELSPSKGEEMMREIRGPHLLTARDGSQDYCGGPGKCRWCDREKNART